MSTEAPRDSSPPPTGGLLQFDHAESSVDRATKCAECTRPIGPQYFKVNEQIVCESCRKKYEPEGSTKFGRFCRAGIYGTIAAAIGSGIYYAVLAMTGYQIGLISILVGVMVGHAVHNGSGRRGGWRYQLLAIFLTYASIASSYVPLIVAEARNINKRMAVQEWETNRNNAATRTPAATPADETVVAEDTQLPTLSFGEFLKAIAILTVFVFAVPILSGFESPVILFIIGIGLYEAWKINRRVERVISGPISLNPKAEVASGSASS
jgi:hypothetical protein